MESMGKAEFDCGKKFTTCFDCPEFNKSGGYCRRANESKPCIKKEQEEKLHLSNLT
jgi:hypothetical protein